MMNGVEVSKMTINENDIIIVTVDDEIIKLHYDKLQKWLYSIRKVLLNDFYNNKILLVSKGVEIEKLEKRDTYDKLLGIDWEVK